MTNSQRRLAWILPLFLVCGTAIAEGKRVTGHSSGCLAVIYGLRCGLVPTSGTRVTHLLQKAWSYMEGRELLLVMLSNGF